MKKKSNEYKKNRCNECPMHIHIGGHKAYFSFKEFCMIWGEFPYCECHFIFFPKVVTKGIAKFLEYRNTLK